MAVPGPDSKKGPVGNSHSLDKCKELKIEGWMEGPLKPNPHSWTVGEKSSEVAKIVRGALSWIPSR